MIQSTWKYIESEKYFFNPSKCAANCVISLRHIWFHRSKDFEAMKAGRLAVRPWLVCQYIKNTLVDLPSSVAQYIKIVVFLPFGKCEKLAHLTMAEILKCKVPSAPLSCSVSTYTKLLV